jgi:Ubiquinol cytochrome reductase transmembrane region
MGGDTASKIPDFSHYRSKQGSNSNLVFQYFMVGTMGALTAMGAKATVQGMWICAMADMVLKGAGGHQLTGLGAGSSIGVDG